MLGKIKKGIGVFLVIMIYSCGPIPQSYFTPHEANTLKLRDKKELKVAGGYLSNTTTSNTFGSSFGVASENITSKKSRASFQAAYSPLKYLGVFGIHSRLKFVGDSFDNLFHKSHLTGGGVGTYYNFSLAQRPIDRLKPGQTPKYTKILFDLYGGYTIGKLENRYYLPSGRTKMSFQKFYVQIGAHWEGTHWGFSYVHKLGKVNYFNGIIDGKPNNQNDAAIQSIVFKNNLFFQESTLKMDVNVKGIGFYSQLSTGNIRDFNFNSIPNPIIHFGIVLNIPEVRKLIKNEN